LAGRISPSTFDRFTELAPQHDPDTPGNASQGRRKRWAAVLLTLFLTLGQDVPIDIGSIPIGKVEVTISSEAAQATQPDEAHPATGEK
jgi:hypothetical protein